MQSTSLSKPLTFARFFVLTLLVAMALLTTTGPAMALTSPERLPAFSLPGVDGQSVVDVAQHRGKVLLINFWATWCGPCREEIPTLVALQEEFAPQGFAVIGISMDDGSRRLVERFVKRLGITYPVAMGDSKTARAFGGIFGIPQSFLVNREGIIVKSYMGVVEPEVFRRDIASLLGRR